VRFSKKAQKVQIALNQNSYLYFLWQEEPVVVQQVQVERQQVLVEPQQVLVEVVMLQPGLVEVVMLQLGLVEVVMLHQEFSLEA
jgi:hypothetical protein